MLPISVLNLTLILFGFALFLLVFGYDRVSLKYRHFEGITLISYLIHGVRSRDIVCKLAAEKDAKFIKWLFPMVPGVIATHPDSLKWVLSNPQLFPKVTGVAFKSMRKLYDRTIINSNGEDWKKFRTALNSPFRYDVVKNWIDDFRQSSLELMEIWSTQVDKPIDILHWLPGFTIDVLGKTTFSREFNAMKGTKNEYFQAFNNLMSAFSHRTTILAAAFEALTGLSLARDIEKNCELLYNFILDIIENKRNSSNLAAKSMDIVDMMLTFHDPPFTTEEVISNAFIMFLAGHETTATALSWMFYNLGVRPDIQQKAAAEVWNVLKGNKITGDDLSKLEYVNMVIKENMRIRPPVALIFTRVAAEDVEFEGYKIPKGTRIGLGIEAVHMNPKFWPNPKEFIPERFASEQKHVPFTYLPFSMQSRACLGKHFSLVEQVVFMATLLQRFTWTVHSCDVDEPYSAVLNKPKELKVKLQNVDPSVYQKELPPLKQ
jgi:cytochrome P450